MSTGRTDIRREYIDADEATKLIAEGAEVHRGERGGYYVVQDDPKRGGGNVRRIQTLRNVQSTVEKNKYSTMFKETFEKIMEGNVAEAVKEIYGVDTKAEEEGVDVKNDAEYEEIKTAMERLFEMRFQDSPAHIRFENSIKYWDDFVSSRANKKKQKEAHK
jgi:ribosomal protein L23